MVISAIDQPLEKDFRRIVFWQNMPSHHQAETLKALARLGWRVAWITNSRVSESRRRTGWSDPDTTGLEALCLDEMNAVEVDAQIDTRDLHVFTPRGTKAAGRLLRRVIAGEIRYGFICEKPNGKGIKLFASCLFYGALARLLPPPSLFLSMGEYGADYYRSVGFEAARPFWYTVPAAPIRGDRIADPRHRFVVVARLVRLKRVDRILDALANLASPNWTLDIVGEGPERAALEAIVRAKKLSDQVRLLGALPADQARSAIAAADTLVLASEWEGWGAVINEAMAEGARFVVSDACGSSCLAPLSPGSRVFDSSSTADLTDALREQVSMGPVGPADRRTLRNQHRLVDGMAAALYLVEALRGDAIPPWAVLGQGQPRA